MTALPPRGEIIPALATVESDNPDPDGNLNLTQMESEEEERLLRQDQENLALDEELEHDENTDWLRGSGWPRWFAQKPLHIIVAATTLPSRDCYRELYLGTWYGVECTSTVASERALYLSLQATQQVLERCEETLRQTPRVLRCWLRSWTFSYLPYPFEMPRARASRSTKEYGRNFCAMCSASRVWLVTYGKAHNISPVFA